MMLTLNTLKTAKMLKKKIKNKQNNKIISMMLRLLKAKQLESI